MSERKVAEIFNSVKKLIKQKVILIAEAFEFKDFSASND